MNYTFTRAHYPNTVSWYRELVHLDGELVAEISEPTDSTFANRIFRIREYEPLTDTLIDRFQLYKTQVADGVVYILGDDVARFNTVCDCKDFINNGGLQ